MATTTETRNNNGRDKAQSRAKNDTGDTSNFGKLAGATMAGAALGVLAMLGRKAVVQSPTVMAGDWMDGLIAEHKMVLKLFDALQATDDSSTSKRSILLTQIKHALAKHALEEENVIYPALREAGKTEAADALNQEHGYVKQYLYELENMPNNSPMFLEKVAKFRADLEKHMAEEENDLFPALRTQLAPEKNKLLTTSMNKEGFKLA